MMIHYIYYFSRRLFFQSAVLVKFVKHMTNIRTWTLLINLRVNFICFKTSLLLIKRSDLTVITTTKAFTLAI